MGLFDKIRQIARHLEKKQFPLWHGRHVIQNWVREMATRGNSVTVLDIGCGKGDDLINVKNILPVGSKLYGIEGYEEYQEICRKKGIEVTGLNLERDPYPYDKAFFDLIILNQVLEHTKDTYYLLAEISRILKPGGILIIGVPNLASWHDRIELLFGIQPSSMKQPGPHIRGYTPSGLSYFVQYEGYFNVTDIKGSAFAPFPAFLANPLARFFPKLASGLFVRCERTEKVGTFMEVLVKNFYETNFYKGK